MQHLQDMDAAAAAEQQERSDAAVADDGFQSQVEIATTEEQYASGHGSQRADRIVSLRRLRNRLTAMRAVEEEHAPYLKQAQNVAALTEAFHGLAERLSTDLPNNFELANARGVLDKHKTLACSNTGFVKHEWDASISFLGQGLPPPAIGPTRPRSRRCVLFANARAGAHSHADRSLHRARGHRCGDRGRQCRPAYSQAAAGRLCCPESRRSAGRFVAGRPTEDNGRAGARHRKCATAWFFLCPFRCACTVWVACLLCFRSLTNAGASAGERQSPCSADRSLPQRRRHTGRAGEG